jgi:acetylornithine deacetylase/succinyl-diaminopimelate desuccinylase-like protein
MRLKQGEEKMLHGIDERMRIDNFAEICRFYVQLIRNFNA